MKHKEGAPPDRGNRTRVVPIDWLWLGSAKYLPASRVGLIFSLEAVVGIITAALLAGEPFGWRRG